jgi:hypothetical protein
MYMKLRFLSSVFLLSFLLSGCGESIDEISQKDKVIILHDVETTGWVLLENYGNSKREEQDIVKDTSYTSKENSVTCETFGKRRGYIDDYNNIDADVAECVELTLADVQEAFPDEDLSIYENTEKSCVLSFNLQ